MQTHVIRLRGPWEYAFVSGASAGLAEQGRVPFPGAWPKDVAALEGIVRLTRHFHRPTGLNDDERVWLTLSGQARTGGITLNEEPLSARQAAAQTGTETARENALRLEISSLLKPRNTLIVELLKRAEEPDLCGLVCLEIGSCGG